MSENFLNRNRGCGDMVLYGCLLPAILLVAIIAVIAMATAAEGATIRLTAGADPDPETGIVANMTLMLAFNPANDRVTSGFIQGQSAVANWEVWTARQVTGTFDGTNIDVKGLGSFNGFQSLGKEVATLNVSADLSGRDSAFDLTYPDDPAFEHLAGYSTGPAECTRWYGG